MACPPGQLHLTTPWICRKLCPRNSALILVDSVWCRYRGEQFTGRAGPIAPSRPATLGFLWPVWFGVGRFRCAAGRGNRLDGRVVELEPILRNVLPFDDMGLGCVQT